MSHCHTRYEDRFKFALIGVLLFAATPAGVSAAPEFPREAQLQELLSEAARNSPEIRAAGNERLAAQQRVLPAGALDDPMLEAGVINAPLASQPFRREDMTMKMLGLSQRIPYPGKRDLRQDVAAKDAESIGYAYQETVNRVLRDVKVAYFELALSVESARVVERNRQVLEQFLQISESRYGVGQGTQADVLKAQTQLSRMTDELIKLARERRTIEAELTRVLGRAPSAGVPAPAALRLREAPLQLDTLLETALRERPQLLGLKSLVERSARTLDLARKDYYPDFDVKLSYGQRDRTLEGMRRDDMVSFTVAINLPVWRETKRDPRVAEAIAMRDQASDMYEAQRNELVSRLRQQAANAEQSLKSARLYETGVLPQARLAVESSLAAYRVNRVDFLTLLDSQMTVLNYEISHASALSSYNKALAEMEFLTGKSGL
ncbi:MAG: TolC family protein [Proteobacteria bacterium]|nr:TolC family protein [Pseudomonadota bacterium]